MKAGAGLWRAFAGRSAVDFDVARRDGHRYFADLPRVMDPYGYLFPQVGGRGSMQLTLSELDQVVFDRLQADTWLRPADLVPGNARMFDFFGCFGDRFLPRRLRDWAGHTQQDPAVLMKEEAKGVNEMTATSYQLTAFGVRLRDQGLETPGEAPPMFIGGCRLYAKNPTWIRRNRGEHWQIEQLVV
jgi:hypothetical protein